jgi:hypothetical protein
MSIIQNQRGRPVCPEAIRNSVTPIWTMTSALKHHADIRKTPDIDDVRNNVGMQTL